MPIETYNRKLIISQGGTFYFAGGKEPVRVLEFYVTAKDGELKLTAIGEANWAIVVGALIDLVEIDGYRHEKAQLGYYEIHNLKTAGIVFASSNASGSLRAPEGK